MSLFVKLCLFLVFTGWVKPYRRIIATDFTLEAWDKCSISSEHEMIVPKPPSHKKTN